MEWGLVFVRKIMINNLLFNAVSWLTPVHDRISTQLGALTFLPARYQPLHVLNKKIPQEMICYPYIGQ